MNDKTKNIIKGIVEYADICNKTEREDLIKSLELETKILKQRGF